MSVWAMLLVTPSGRPAPSESARRTRAVIDGWDSWLLPITKSGELLPPSWARDLGLLFVVTGDGTHGELNLWSRRSFTLTPIEPVDGEGGWGFRRPTLDVIEGFIKESGPRGVRRAKVVDAITSTFDTQLHAVHGLLHSLRLSRNDAFAVEDYLAGHTIDDPELPDVFRSDPRGSGVRAIALDHESAGWHRLVASQDLYDYGEPPCLVQADVGGLFVASDPPVALRFFNDKDLADKVGAGDWVEVPAASAGSVAEFIAWARQNVGVAGIAVSTPRRPLRGEVDDEPPRHTRDTLSRLAIPARGAPHPRDLTVPTRSPPDVRHGRNRTAPHSPPRVAPAVDDRIPIRRQRRGRLTPRCVR